MTTLYIIIAALALCGGCIFLAVVMARKEGKAAAEKVVAEKDAVDAKKTGTIMAEHWDEDRPVDDLRNGRF